MPQITKGDTTLEIRELMPWGRRVLFLMLGVFPWLAPYELLIRTNWISYLNILFVLSLVISLGALFLSGLLIFAAFAGLSTLLRFDASTQTFTYLHQAPIVPLRREVIRFQEIETITVETREWSDGPDSYYVQVLLMDGRQFKTSSFLDEPSASEALNAVEDLIRKPS